MGLNSEDLLLAGATGLVGGLVLRRLLADRDFEGTIYAPVRRDPGIADPRLVPLPTDFSPGSGDFQLAAQIRGRTARPLDAYVCCLGTTLRAAGSREAFNAVDRDLVLRTAQLAYDNGARHAVLVSSVGASRQSGNFYVRIKGEVEDAVEKIGFTRLDLIQPGLLIGERTERRPVERLMQKLAPAGNVLMQGGLSRYRSIPADLVAAAIQSLLALEAPGVFTHRYASLRELAASAPASR